MGTKWVSRVAFCPVITHWFHSKIKTKISHQVMKSSPLGLLFRLRFLVQTAEAWVSSVSVWSWSEFCIAVWREQRRSGRHLRVTAGTAPIHWMQSYLHRESVSRRIDEWTHRCKIHFSNSMFSADINTVKSPIIPNNNSCTQQLGFCCFGHF